MVITAHSSKTLMRCAIEKANQKENNHLVWPFLYIYGTHTHTNTHTHKYKYIYKISINKEKKLKEKVRDH